MESKDSAQCPGAAVESSSYDLTGSPAGPRLGTLLIFLLLTTEDRVHISCGGGKH